MRRLLGSLLIGIFIAWQLASPPAAAALPLATKSLFVTPVEVSASAVYQFDLSTASAGTLGSLKLQVCENYQFTSTDTCVAATGFNASSATLGAQAGTADFSLVSAGGNVLVLNRPPTSLPAGQDLNFTIDNVHNPAGYGTYYVWVSTYANTTASGPATDDGQLLFATNRSIAITTEVPPYLLFCSGVTIPDYDCSSAEGSSVSFGELSSRTSRSATSQLLTSTNAESGYSISVAGTSLTAGNSVIGAMASQDAARPGSNQFGLNVRANTSPASGHDPEGPGLAGATAAYDVPNRYKFSSGDTIVRSLTGDDYRRITVSYVVNITSDQPAGNYASTVNFICLANF